MSVLEYDRVLAERLSQWLPSETNLRVLPPDETKRLFETLADDSRDKAVTLPLIALSRSNDIDLLLNVKSEKSFRGIKLKSDANITRTFNAIPIDLHYSLDIYAKKQEDALDYVRDYLFKIINNPKMLIDIPYLDEKLKHLVYMRVGDSVSDTSDISQHLFPGEFYRWTIQIQLFDAHLFAIKDHRNWAISPDTLVLDITDSEPII